jgi:hypothetical protein
MEVELHQCHGQPVAGFVVDGALQAREGRPAGQIRLIPEAATDQLEERVRVQGVRIILIFPVTGNLEDPLTNERLA